MSSCGLHCLKISHIGVQTDGHTLLKDVNLHVHCGELTAIIGRNGAGKTTLLKAILGEIPHTGSVAFSGHNGPPVVDGKPRVGYVPQALSLDRNTPASVYDVLLSLTEGYPAFFPNRRKTVERFRAHLARFRADELLDQPIGRLSGGELQRVLLAAATLPTPDLLVLDEPVSGVDNSGLAEFYSLLQQLKEQEDMVILLVSHDREFAEFYGDRVIELKDGKIISDVSKTQEEKQALSENVTFFRTFGHRPRVWPGIYTSREI